jgi:hypothetical protein
MLPSVIGSIGWSKRRFAISDPPAECAFPAHFRQPEDRCRLAGHVEAFPAVLKAHNDRHRIAVDHDEEIPLALIVWPLDLSNKIAFRHRLRLRHAPVAERPEPRRLTTPPPDHSASTGHVRRHRAEIPIVRAAAPTISNRTGKPGRAGANIAGSSGRPVVFCGRPGTRTASSDRPALCRARRGRRPDGCARRSPSPRQETDDHAGGQGMAGVAGVPEGEGPRLSPRTVDDPASTLRAAITRPLRLSNGRSPIQFCDNDRVL